VPKPLLRRIESPVPSLAGTGFAASNDLRVYFCRIHIQLANGLSDNATFQLAFLGQGIESGNYRELGIDFKKAAQSFAGVAAPKPIRPERG